MHQRNLLDVDWSKIPEPSDDGAAAHLEGMEIPSLNLTFTATLAGGSRTDCESWFLLLEPIEKTSH